MSGNGECMIGEEQSRRRIRLRVAYDGTDYCGWQIQNNGITIEQCLTEALLALLKEEIELIGASRTDSGVHALANVAVFDTASRIPAEKFAIALNHYLPDTIRVLQSEGVPADFHPRYCDSVKTYDYAILVAPIEIPVLQRYRHHVYQKLDIEKMREAAECIVGTHDFSAFCSAGSQVKTKVRTVLSLDVQEKELENPVGVQYGQPIRDIHIRVSGNGFLYNMVRIIAGTLLEVGMGRRSIESVREAVASGDRAKAGPTAPAKGLTLVGIAYPEK